MGSLEGRIAVITGAGRGIGRAIALRYASEGATIVISSRTESDLEDVLAQAATLGAGGRLVVADATDRADARRPVTDALEHFGAVDILVNNAGGTVGRGHNPFAAPYTLEQDDSFERTLLLNLTTAWWTSQAALPGMRERGYGRIINIGSGAAKMTGGSIAYTAAKHGLVGLTKQLALLVGELGITVNCLCPGWTNTSLVDWEAIGRARQIPAEEAERNAARESAQNRILEPAELTGLATLLASQEGRGITGQVLSVDGGYRI